MNQKRDATPRAEREAALLFDLMNGDNKDAVNEVGEILDGFIDASNRVYGNKKFFTEMYAEARAEGTDSKVNAILRLLRNGASPAEIARLLKHGEGERKPRQKAATRRIRIGVRRFEKYGIMRGDTAIVVMDGDVRAGELGYFGITCTANDPADSYMHFTFVCEQDSTCYNVWYNGSRKLKGVCLRHENLSKCNGHHNGTPYGRVCAVERNRQPVETSLQLRPFDEQERRGELTSIPQPQATGATSNRTPHRKQLIEEMSEPWPELRDDWQRFIKRIEGDTK